MGNLKENVMSSLVKLSIFITDHNVDLPLADCQVLVVVDAHPLEGEAGPVAGLGQEDNGKPALCYHILEARKRVTHRVFLKLC